jgi:inorganic pyrophosphatase
MKTDEQELFYHKDGLEDEPPLGYIMNLRRFIGHMPLITIGAGVIIENEEGKVLLGRRRDNGMWDLGGGGMELGESLEDCAKRELFEEMGLTAHSLEFLDIFSGRPPITCPSGDIIEHVAVIYICRDFSGELKAQEEEVCELRWFSVDTLIKDITQITPPSRIFFERYFENRKQNNNDFWSALDALIEDSELVIDRPKGSKHPRFDFIYPLDYGYIKNTASMDGDGIDVWRGSLPDAVCDAIICTIDAFKRDSEIKILLGCSKDEKDEILRFHNDSQYMKGIMIRREV